MPIAAIPHYLGTDFTHAPPGMRFGMYLKLWDAGWSKSKDGPLDSARRLNPNDQKTMKALLARQQQAFNTSAGADASLRLDALATAPFTTGLGNEHPLENGFAFLNPYGLPYLPGSGVKGVLRQAARELASGEWGDTRGWSEDKRYTLMEGEGKDRRLRLDNNNRNKQPVMLSMLDVLFGREAPEGDSGHVRGALTFWDVIPQIKGDHLAVEIMTPHQGHYYQQKQDPKTGHSTTPHDSGQPVPISFLTVPPGSGFAFHVVCDTAHLRRLAPEMAEAGNDGAPVWKTLLTAAFEHAFAWLGFGAKTAVGYGSMEKKDPGQAPREGQSGGAATQKGVQEAIVWHGAHLKFNRANKSLTAEKDGGFAIAIAPKGEELLARLPVEIRSKVESNQHVKVTARVSGRDLLEIET
ncbi:MAG: hypothetical protein OHK0018_14520 [Erythrobacter tepidarius]